MNYEKTPWKYIGNGDVVDASDGDVCTVHLRLDYEADAIGRRIVACVNACQGAKTVDLEALGKDYIKVYSDVIRQRDDLLTCLIAAASLAEHGSPAKKILDEAITVTQGKHHEPDTGLGFSIIEIDRIFIRHLKSEGATEYVFVAVGVWDGQGGESGKRKHGEAARKIVDAAYPGIANGIDPDKSDWKSGKLAFLLPKK